MPHSNSRTEFEGVDLPEALKRAAEALGIPEDDLDYEILEQGRRGLFGIGAKSVRIRVMPPLDEELPDPRRSRPRRRRPAAEAAPARGAAEAGAQRRASRGEASADARAAKAPAGAADEPADASKGRERGGRRRREGSRRRRRGRGRGERGDAEGARAPRGERNAGGASENRPARESKPAREPKQAREPKPARESKPAPPEQLASVESTLRRMVELMGLEVEPSVAPGADGVDVKLEGPDEQALWSNDNDLAGALQFLLNRMARRSWPDAGRIRLATDGHDTRRDEDLVALVREAAAQVLDNGRPRRLAPMNAYERRIVHITVREMEGLGSKSEGQGALKRVRIFKARGPRRRRNASRPEASQD